MRAGSNNDVATGKALIDGDFEKKSENLANSVSVSAGM